MSPFKKELKQEAINRFTQDVVEDVIFAVEFSGLKEALELYEDELKFWYVECLEFLYSINKVEEF